jgi:general secretion pathway protein G
MVNRIPIRTAASMQGFSRQESLGILSVIAMLAAIAGASYARNYYAVKIFEAKQAILREDCQVVGQAVNSYRQDKGHAPASLDDLVQSGYLVALPQGLKKEDCTW